jgi:hypothetical protein
MQIFYTPRQFFISPWYWVFGLGGDNGGRLHIHVFGLTFKGPRIFKPVPMGQR